MTYLWPIANIAPAVHDWWHRPNPVYDYLLRETAAGRLSWSCGSHSDLWTGRHQRFTVGVDESWFGFALNIRSNEGAFCYLKLWFWQFRRLLRSRPRNVLTTYDFLRSLQ